MNNITCEVVFGTWLIGVMAGLFLCGIFWQEVYIKEKSALKFYAVVCSSLIWPIVLLCCVVALFVFFLPLYLGIYFRWRFSKKGNAEVERFVNLWDWIKRRTFYAL